MSKKTHAYETTLLLSKDLTVSLILQDAFQLQTYILLLKANNGANKNGIPVYALTANSCSVGPDLLLYFNCSCNVEGLYSTGKFLNC